MVMQHHRPFRRYLMGQDPFSSRCTLLTGQRGVGKTTCLVQHLADQYPDYRTSLRCLYLPVDHFVVAQRPVYEIATDFANGGGELLCLDEVHKSLTWSRDLMTRFNTFQNTVNLNDHQFNLKVLQEQASPEEAESLLKNGHWPWSQDTQTKYF